MSRRKATVLLFLILLPMLTGCWNMKELEHMFYAHAIGVDYQNGEYRMYVQILDFSKLSKTEGGGGGEDGGTGAWIGRGAGKTLYDALHDLYSSSQREIYWGHLNTIILSDKLFHQEKYLEAMDILTRYGELRYTPWLFATGNNVEDILLVSPVLERSPVYSQLSDPFDVFEQSSFIPPIRLNRFFARLLEPASTLLVPFIGSVGDKWEDAKQTYDALEVKGAYFIRNKQLKAELPKSQLQGLRWMNEQTRRTPLVLGSEKQTVSLVFEKIDTDIVPHIEENGLYFDVRVSAKGGVIGDAKTVSAADLQKQAEQRIRQEIADTFMRGIEKKADVYNLMEVAYRKVPREWKRIAAANGFPLRADSIRSIRVDVRITNAGKNNKPLPETGSKP